jgi:DNA-directed RNA polymerase beta' subunit
MEEQSCKEIESITFGIFSPEEIKKQSVCLVQSNKLQGKESVYDERMGTLEQNIPCASCNQDCEKCPGHFGHIELNVLIMHPMYHRQIVNFLKCFCFKCYRFILTKDHLESILKYKGEARFLKILERLEKEDSCFHGDCQHIKPKVSYNANEGIINIAYNDKAKNVVKTQLKEEEIKKVFDNVSNEDVRLLGFDPGLLHPKNLILSVLPVLPPISRPYVVSESVTCDDDLTTQYLEIIKTNNHLKDEDIPEVKKNKLIQTLKFRIKTLMNNSQGKARHTNGKALRAIKERISGKEGLIRSHLMGDEEVWVLF